MSAMDEQLTPLLDRRRPNILRKPSTPQPRLHRRGQRCRPLLDRRLCTRRHPQHHQWHVHAAEPVSAYCVVQARLDAYFESADSSSPWTPTTITSRLTCTRWAFSASRLRKRGASRRRPRVPRRSCSRRLLARIPIVMQRSISVGRAESTVTTAGAFLICFCRC